MNEQELFSQFWRERCNEAIDNLRDDPLGGHAIGAALAEQGKCSRNLAMQQAGLLVQAQAVLRSGQNEQAQAMLDKIAEKLCDDPLTGLQFHYVQGLILSAEGRYQAAYEYGQQHLLPRLNDNICLEGMRTLIALGVFASEFNHPEEAMRHYFHAAELVRTLHLPTWWLAHIHANLGEILCNSGNANDAAPLLQEAMNLANVPGKAWLQSYVASIFAVCQLALEQYEAASQTLNPQIIRLEQEVTSGNTPQLPKAALCVCIAIYTFAKLGQLEKAERLLSMLEQYADQIGEQQHHAYVCWVRGHLLHQRDALPQALHALQEAVDALGDVTFDFMPLRVRLEMSEIYSKLGDWQRALQEYQHYHTLYVRAQGEASRMHLQVLHIQAELREAETARRHAEQAMAERRELADNLRQSLAERDTILDNSMVGIAFLDPQAQVRWANAALANILGLPNASCKGMTFQEFFADSADYARMQETVLSVHNKLGESPPFEAECRMQRADGSLIWVYLSGRMVRADAANSGTVWVLMDITRRHQLELELNRSEAQHRLVVDNAVEGIAVLQEGKIVFANPSILQLNNLPRERVINAPFLDFVHPDDRGVVMQRHLARLHGEEFEKYLTFRTIRHDDGSLRWIEASAVLIEWEDRPATVIFVNDITERKTLQDHLQASLQEREIILENSMVGISFLNPQGRVKWANSAMVQMFGGSLKNYLGASLESLYPSREAYIQTGAQAAQALCDGQAFNSELQMRRANGELFWASLSGQAVNRRDLSQGTVWAVMDIDKRRKLEQELAKSEEHHRQVVDNVTEGIMVVQDGKIVFANPRVLQISGRSQQELFSMPFLADVHPDDLDYVLEQHQRRTQGAETEKNFCFRTVNPHTHEITWIEISAVVIEWEGRPASLSFLNDITNRRNLEESLRQSHAERVHLQTLQFQHELKEAELARRHAEETTKAKSMFLANMSHEIRTPMNAIIGMAHLALCSELSPKQRDYVEKIHNAGISLLGIINDILDFSRIEAGKLNIETVEFDLDKVLANLSTVTSDKAREKELQYLFQIPSKIPRNLIGDPLRLGQVLINLVNNAIKFTEKGGVYLSCLIRENANEKVLLEFVVRDTGIGMHPDQVAKLFTAFSQADESTTRKYGGTGLGLSIAKGMVELMGGKIWLESTPEVGTSMHFTAWFGLPAQQRRQQILPPEIDGMRVLVVDDSPTARLALAEIMSNLPIEVDFAFGVSEALAAIRACDDNWPYGIVFTAQDMPGADGMKLVHEVHAHAHLKTIPRMVLLADGGHEHLRDEPLLDGFLNKPVSASALIDCLMDMFASNNGTGHGPLQDTPMFNDLTVLLVEDNDINQMIATELMQAVGIKVETANNGRQALETLQTLGPDYFGLVFMDVQMPEMDGHEATEKIRADARFANLPIIAMTAHAMVEERNRCLNAGMNDHIAKPINPGEFYHIISCWCSQYLSNNSAPLGNAAQAGLLAMGANLAPQMNSLPLATVESKTQTLQIPGLDAEDGLSRMLGDQAMYLELLLRFRDGQQDVVSKIAQALANGEQKLAERFAHTLKGVAAMIGARQVQECAGQLENSCRQGAASLTLETQLAQLEQEMQILLSGIAGAISGQVNQQSEEISPLDRAEIQQALNTFAQLLRQNDGDAIDFLAEHSQQLALALGPDAHRRIVRATRQFDFDLALDALDKGAHAAEYALE